MANSIKYFWYKFLGLLIVKIYFGRVRLLQKKNIAKKGPVLYVGIHRNGAVDGWVYRAILLRRPILLIS